MMGIYGTQFRINGPIKVRTPPVEKWSWRPFNPGKARLATRQVPRWPYAVQTNYSPSRASQKVVLMFETGPLAPGLIYWLKRNRMKFFCLDYYGQFVGRGVVTLLAGKEAAGEMRLGEACLRLDDVAAVIWGQIPVGKSMPTKPFARHVSYERWRQVLRDLRSFLPLKTLWLPSHPLNGSPEWQNKLSELVEAGRVGLTVPETLCTNDPAEAEAFIARHRGRVLFREFSPAADFGFWTEFADGGAALKALPRSPCVFQAYVEKDYEVRSVVIGSKVFSCRIDSQASERTRLDWRLYDDARVRWDRTRLPREIESSMLRLMRKLDLNWASFDLVKSTDGRYCFLELNRPGAQYWLLPFVGLDAPKEIASFIKKSLGRS